MITNETTTSYWTIMGSYELSQFTKAVEDIEDGWANKAPEFGGNLTGSGAGWGLRDVEFEFDNEEGTLKMFEILRDDEVIEWSVLEAVSHTDTIIGAHNPSLTK